MQRLFCIIIVYTSIVPFSYLVLFLQRMHANPKDLVESFPTIPLPAGIGLLSFGSKTADNESHKVCEQLHQSWDRARMNIGGRCAGPRRGQGAGDDAVAARNGHGATPRLQ